MTVVRLWWRNAQVTRLSARTLLEAGGAFAGGAFLAGAYCGMLGAVLGSVAGFVVVLATSTNVRLGRTRNPRNC